MSVQRQFGKAVAWMAFGLWVEQAFNFLVFVVLARLLGAEAFGLLAMAAVFIVLSEFLVRQTISEYLIVSDNLRPAHINAAFWILALFSLVLAGALALVAGPISRAYGAPEVAPVIQALCATIPMVALSSPSVALLRRDLQFRVLSLRAIAGVVAGGVVGLVLAFSGFGVWALVAQRLVMIAVNAVMAWFAVSWRPSLATDLDAARDVARLGFSVVVLRGAEIARTQLPIAMVGGAMGPVAAGYYSIAWRIIELSTFLMASPVLQAAQPAFAQMVRLGEDAGQFLLKIVRIIGFLAFPAYIGLGLLALPFLSVLFGAKWVDAAPVLSAMAALGVYLSIEAQHQAFCLAQGRALRISLMTWAEAAAIVLALWLTLPLGLVWATASVPAVLVLLWPVRLAIVAAGSGLRPTELLAPHIRPFVLSAAMGALVFGLMQVTTNWPYVVQLGALSLVGAVSYAALSLTFLRDRLTLAQEFVATLKKSQ